MLEEQADFYSSVLGLNIIERSDNQLLIELGASVLCIEFRKAATPYHFAINIPANKEVEALAWLKERVDILKDGEHEIQDFDFWNAKAIYFYDADNNIVELIARRNMNNSSSERFGSNALLEISEIGMATTDIESKFDQLNKKMGVKMFDGGFERFCAIGDESGLFICINRNEKKWFPVDDYAYPSAFEVVVVEQGMSYHVVYESEALSIISEA